MMATCDAKICGLSTPETVEAAARLGARWVGFVHFEKSPRHLPREAGRALVDAARQANPDIETVLLLVNPEPDFAVHLADEWGVDHIQFHGTENNALLSAVRALRPSGELWKALPVSEAADLEAVKAYPAADRFLFDAKPPKGADRPGGWGHRFDWRILAGFDPGRPYLLAGGLTPENVHEAIAISGTRAVDLSSGVESEKGVKDLAKIRAFLSGLAE